ncbi:hypothetical protein AB0M28_19890 [Streptomyces sp. NPDC051940]|uniref:hypothetical protein n=1 Tax=Streptomyces sp. NPDC051940 TaxID=3155675 RepID=UPI003438C652
MSRRLSRDAWTSALSTGEFAAVRSVGFEPVGQVMGTAVFRMTDRPLRGADTGYYDCGCGPQALAAGRGVPVVTSGSGAASRELVGVRGRARQLALRRIADECAALDGDGVVAARLTETPFATGQDCVEFQVIGTAVRAVAADTRPGRPFTTHLDGRGLARLLTAGVVPVSVVVGHSIGVRHRDWATSGETGLGAPGREIRGYTELVERTRHDARDQLRVQGRHNGADGIILRDRGELRIRSEHCRRRELSDHGHDDVAEATLFGTAVASFRPAARPAGRMTVVPLDRLTTDFRRGNVR